MTDPSQKPGPGHGDEIDSGDALDIDLDFDLEALASAPAPGGAVVPEPPSEPEVVVFSRGNVVAAPSSIAPSVASFPPPPGEESPPGTEPDPDEALLDSVEEIEGIFAAPAGEPAVDHALPPRREVRGKRQSSRSAKAPSTAAADLSPTRGVAAPLTRSFDQNPAPTKLPPRRAVGSPVAETEGGPEISEERPTTPPLGVAGEQEDVSWPDGMSDPPAGDGFSPIPSGSASKDLWSGRVLPEPGAAPGVNRRRTSKGFGARLRSLPLRWLVIGGAGCLGLVVLISMLASSDKDTPGSAGDPVAGSAPEKGSDPLSAVTRPALLDQASALDAITASTPEARILAQYSELASESARRYFAATTVEEMLTVVRDPGRVEPLMREFYARNPLRAKEFLDLVLAPGDDAMIGSKVFWRARIHLKDEGRSFLIFEQLKSGSRKAFLVDWETTVKYNPMRWDAFATECPTEPMEMRVFCTLSTEYRAPFNDDSKYAAFLLTHSDGASEVHAYAERDSEAGRRLLAIAEDDFEVRVYLKLRFAPGSKESVEILEMIDSEDWIVSR